MMMMVVSCRLEGFRLRQFFIVCIISSHVWKVIFRRMRPEVTRQTESVAAAIVSDLQSFQSEQDFLHACRDAANRRITRPV